MFDLHVLFYYLNESSEIRAMHLRVQRFHNLIPAVFCVARFSDASNFEVRTGSGARLRCQQLVGVAIATKTAYPVLGASWVWKSNQTFHKHYTS